MRLLPALLLCAALVPALPAPPVPDDHRDAYIYHGRRSSNLVALTYDDGPNAQSSPQLMALLRELDCPATFFVLGESCERNPRLTAAFATSEFELGNHSMRHPNLREVSAERMRSEVTGLQDLLAAHGAQVRLFRPPYGNANRRVVEFVHGELGMEIVLWSLDTEDWRRSTTAQEIIDRILSQTRGGEIILMHDRADTAEKTIAATRAIVPALRERGLRFVTVSALIEDLRTHPGEASPEATVSRAVPQVPEVVSQR